ncbi:hypothetical protein D6833_03870 [Candidatus Parcubacteria bacterium]|nr:MAG: hypothetical protein D6833_03870 [Candidatus Parcubacteria bacterium]
MLLRRLLSRLSMTLVILGIFGAYVAMDTLHFDLDVGPTVGIYTDPVWAYKKFAMITAISVVLGIFGLLGQRK